MAGKTLIFIPTYDERENAPAMCEEIHKLGLDADVLFVDDGSPDGTGQLLEALRPRFPRLIVQHRAGKLGIGSAHAEAIQWAYDQGYERMVTMDCDFTHSPSDIPQMLAVAEECDMVVGSRWLRENSLPDWNIFRRTMTRLGRVLTHRVLGLAQDASGAFRTYRLDRIPREVFRLVRSRGYPFFFESLFVLTRNRVAIREIPIVLPARTYGHSKMTTAAAARSARYIFELYLASRREPERFLLAGAAPRLVPEMTDPQEWDRYWNQQSESSGVVYHLIAGWYRRAVIKRNLERVIHRLFPQGASLLHAGCGSGQVDAELQHSMRLSALDISPGALRLYARNNAQAVAVQHGTIFDLPYPESSFDGIYNLGVVEHFTRPEIERILTEFRRVLKPGGRAVLFWPHARASSVWVLRAVHFVLRRFLGQTKPLHPPEITHLRSQQMAQEVVEGARLHLDEYRFGPSDGFVQAVVVASKPPAS